jgi:hypothetical protein
MTTCLVCYRPQLKMAESAKAAYLQYYHKIEPKLGSYPRVFQDHLKLIMDQIEHLQFQPHQNWEDQCDVSIEDSMQMIIRNITQDIIDWKALPQQHTSVSLKGNVSSAANRKKKCTTSIQFMESEFLRDAKGVDPQPEENHVSFLCHEVSDSPHWSNYMRFPANMGQMHPKWDTKLEEDSPRFCVTATHTGNVTRAHHDDVSVDSRIMHVAGRKLWLLWDNSMENADKVRNRTIAYGKIDLRWLLDNLTPPKVASFYIS